MLLLLAEASKSSDFLSKPQPTTCECPVRRNSLVVRFIVNFFSGTTVNVLLAFSIRRNLKQICDKTIGQDTISTVHGLRSLSMVWIVLGHVCIVSFKYSGKMNEYYIC